MWSVKCIFLTLAPIRSTYFLELNRMNMFACNINKSQAEMGTGEREERSRSNNRQCRIIIRMNNMAPLSREYAHRTQTPSIRFNRFPSCFAFFRWESVRKEKKNKFICIGNRPHINAHLLTHTRWRSEEREVNLVFVHKVICYCGSERKKLLCSAGLEREIER